MTITLDGVAGVRAHLGQQLGWGPWVEVTQERINTFAEATGDHQWIHVDVERAKDGPFGGTIAHGYLTLSMISDLSRGIFAFSGFKMGVNYGLDKVRFPSPVPVGSRLRVGTTIVGCDDIPGGVQITLEFVVEREGADKPACVAHMLMRQMV
jgi:acyl dehydratase